MKRPVFTPTAATAAALMLPLVPCRETTAFTGRSHMAVIEAVALCVGVCEAVCEDVCVAVLEPVEVEESVVDCEELGVCVRVALWLEEAVAVCVDEAVRVPVWELVAVPVVVAELAAVLVAVAVNEAVAVAVPGWSR